MEAALRVNLEILFISKYIVRIVLCFKYLVNRPELLADQIVPFSSMILIFSI